MFVKKRTLLFLSLCASALNAQLVQADMVNAPSSQVSSSQVAETGGQLSVVDEAGQIKAILSNIQGEIIGVTAQFSTETNSGITVTFSMDEQGRYVAVLDRSAFAEEDQVFSLKLTAQLTDGSFQTLSDYSFEWKKDVVSAAEKPTALDNSDATPSKIEEEATSTTTSSTVNSSLTAGATSSTSNSLTRSSSNTIAGSSNGSASVPSARVSTASSSVNVTQPTGTITIENRNDAQGTFDVRVTNVSSPKDIASVILPTWSQSDDLRWYEATRQSDGSYKLTVNKKDHKYRTGTYTVHLYYKDSSGGLTGAGGTTTHLSEVKPTGTITIENRNDAQGTFDVRVTNVSSPKDISSVILPTWSQTDDLRWYEATRQSDGSYKLTVNKKDHKYRTGTYTVHLYYKDSNGGLTGAGGTTTHLSEAKPTGTITIENRNDAQGTFDVRVTNVSSPKDIASVILPTWSQTDDLRWYEATRQSDGSYKLTVNKKDHKYRTGTYTVHLYYKDSSGGLTGAGGTTTHLSEVKPTGTITIENRNDAQGTFDVRVTNVSSPKDIASVLLPTWSQSDDIRWYEATRQSDGSYKLTVNKKDHKYRTGTYTVHLYYKDSNGGLTGAGGTTTHLSEAKPTGTITIENRNDAQGTFDVRVTNVSSPKDIASVLLPTWSQSDDIRWYEATRQSDGSYKLTVNKKDHKYRTGTYTVHLYYKDSNGGLTGAGGTTTHLSNPSAQRSYTVYIDPGHGGRDSGASYGGVHEKNLALSVSNKLRENLLQYGINVLMTRTGDYDVDFKTERSRMTNASNADLFISIHFNATGAGVSNATGIETYWYQYNPEYQPKINKEMHNNPTRLAESEILANKVQESLIKETGAVNRGVRRETFAVLRETAIPAILVELGFMDNPSELQVIKQDSYHTRLAKALAQGVMNWYGAVEGK
ncbi:GBS Bsp-like repeat-containing protein [Streptococcus suis]|uniref:GBS Bsp-like repeat-containing protein n=1 Tax=Streptococcus suis TaxID=1307 RepID=UPI001CE0ADEC|nr:GBS Bsp-like repeat-containing protein [Streptococcus suis]MCG9918281.1 GBS Bsp-like repeat-containing protein [Streptococcus suis]MCG9920173.1 GBS Bsp-like repeat-containing protein [Streptococcus suis]MCG9924391.1 GBS Bsp-like repeat-containing protein [Streptococcus suis]MCG9926401.1 GBS Bsp-like repeat-containing protein [Streptococcus suis]MCH1563740.1 GBS Bsp-like repeat-containing protein [Streptococcus suis]